MNRILSNSVKFAACVALTLSVTSARAELLSDLINSNGTITVGGLTFNGFSYTQTGNMPNPDSVNVLAYTNGGDAGLFFQGAFLDFPGNGGSDAFVDFHVASTNGTTKIDSVTLAGNPSIIGNGPGLISITETFLPQNSSAISSIFDINPGSTQLSDTVSLGAGYTSLDVQKDILAFAAGTTDITGVPTLSFFTQTFHQVPEPTSVTLLGMGGAVGLLVALRRRRR